MDKLLRKLPCFGDKFKSSSNKDPNKPLTPPAAIRVHQQPLAAPAPSSAPMPYSTPDTLTVVLQNKTNSNTVYAYITGLSIAHNNAPIFVQSDGRSIYFPQSPSTTIAPLLSDVSIPLGAPGSSTTITIPKIAGGRIWFSIGAPLQFYLNPGPAIVEPSVSNPSDANFNTFWGFAEFTYNDAQLFANISYVDFVAMPIGMSLTNASGQTQSVGGLPANGLDNVVNALRAQAQKDGQPWDQLIHSAPNSGQVLRVLSPNNLRVGNANAFNGYFEPYVQAVWKKYASTNLTVNTQASAGNLSGRVQNGQLVFPTAGAFAAPSTADIFSCSTGPFATGTNGARNAVIPRLAAAFNRSMLLTSSETPNGASEGDYYKEGVTNHYSRVLHAVSRDGRGYGFPYDDVVPDGGRDVAGTVFDGAPRVWTVSVGGG